jgi:hypothetical protein
VLSVTSSFKPSRSAISGAIGAHRMPRQCLTAKFTSAGVACSAANTMSPSFSRSASSTTMMGLPARMRRSASSTVSSADGSEGLDRAGGSAFRRGVARGRGLRVPVSSVTT